MFLCVSRGFAKPAPALLHGVARRRFGQTDLALTTVLGQEGDEFIHRDEFGGVADEATFPLPANESHPAEVGQMEGQRGRWQPQLLADGAGVHAVRAGLDEQAEDRQARFMPEGSQAFCGV